MEGSSESVVLERLCAAFEKKGAGAEGKGARGRRVLRPARELASVLGSCRSSPGRAGTGWGLRAEASVPVPACAFIRTRVHSLTYPADVLSSYSVLGTVLYRGEPGSCAP